MGWAGVGRSHVGHRAERQKSSGCNRCPQIQFCHNDSPNSPRRPSRFRNSLRIRRHDFLVFQLTQQLRNLSVVRIESEHLTRIDKSSRPILPLQTQRERQRHQPRVGGMAQKPALQDTKCGIGLATRMQGNRVYISVTRIFGRPICRLPQFNQRALGITLPDQRQAESMAQIRMARGPLQSGLQGPYGRHLILLLAQGFGEVYVARHKIRADPDGSFIVAAGVGQAPLAGRKHAQIDVSLRPIGLEPLCLHVGSQSLPQGTLVSRRKVRCGQIRQRAPGLDSNRQSRIDQKGSAQIQPVGVGETVQRGRGAKTNQRIGIDNGALKPRQSHGTWVAPEQHGCCAASNSTFRRLRQNLCEKTGRLRIPLAGSRKSTRKLGGFARLLPARQKLAFSPSRISVRMTIQTSQ